MMKRYTARLDFEGELGAQIAIAPPAKKVAMLLCISSHF